jgi:peptidoglycan/xylan/chitin deacetylase (PgdA/CDA1 family)
MTPNDQAIWPNGARTALVINVMYEQWDPMKSPGLGPMGNPLPANLMDYQAISWADYGWRTGIWRLLDYFSEEELAATFYLSGILCETAGESIRKIVADGHEICAHAWSQDRLLPSLTEADERAEIARCVEAFERVCGTRPRGWMSPRCTPSAHTARLLAGAGFDWFGDVFDADLPYVIATEEGTITAFPFGLDVNDLPVTVRYGQPARELFSTFTDVVAGLEDLGRIAYIDATVHAHVGARPAGMAALRQIVAHAREHGMWIATRSDVAAWLAPVRDESPPG